MQKNRAKVHWSCRRGMKELDLLLQPFFDAHYQQLTDAQKAYFEQLLQLDDLVLFDCFFKRKPLHDCHLQTMVDMIKSHRQHVAY